MAQNDSLATSARAEVTLQDVAREAGVHPSTVSRALDPTKADRVRHETRQHIREIAGRLGYRPHLIARGLQTGRTATIAFIAADLGNTFVTPIIHGLAGAIQADGMLPVIAETQDDHETFATILDHMLSRRVDGMVVAAARAGDREILESAARAVPIVLAGRPLDDSTLPHVVHNDRQGGELAAAHLADLGHTRVAQLRGPADVANFPRRAAGFDAVAADRGLEIVEVEESGSHPIASEGERLMARLLEMPGDVPTAVFAHNDLMALGANSALGARGLRVPEDVSLIGYNDLPLVGRLTPPLTTIRYPSLEVGRSAGELIIQLLGGERGADHPLRPELIVRASTAPPAGT
jgi:LacI family transcriptional regulator